jgi:micrococcal nuclease
VDGDTFWIDNGTAKGLKVRLIGVNAPESRKTNRKDVEYFGKEAKNYLIKFLSNKRVRLVYDIAPKDRYGRALAYVYLEDGTFLNAHLVKNGYASVMTIPPNVKYADYFVKLQREARLNKRGLWRR